MGVGRLCQLRWYVLSGSSLGRYHLQLPEETEHRSTSIVRSDKKDQYVDAYVKEPIPGPYEWVVSFDLNSLYPSLIRFLNISPGDTLDHKHERIAGQRVEKLINKETDVQGTTWYLCCMPMVNVFQTRCGNHAWVGDKMYMKNENVIRRPCWQETSLGWHRRRKWNGEVSSNEWSKELLSTRRW